MQALLCPKKMGVSKFICSAVILIVAGGGTSALSQTVHPDAAAIGGLRPQLPTVPVRDPRLNLGAGAEQRWQTGRTGDDKLPVGSFFDTLEANDSALEVVVGQGRLLTTKADIASGQGTAVIAVGDPTILDFQVLPNPRMIRLVGSRAGVTDLSIMMADGQACSFEVHVVYDLQLLRAQLKQIFPDAYLQLAQIREHLVVEGQARSPAQVTQILQTIDAYLASVQVSREVSGQRPAGNAKDGRRPPSRPSYPARAGGADPNADGVAS